MIFLPFFALGGMGGGDVKLLAAFGAWLGPYETLSRPLFRGVAGGALAVVVAFSRGYLRVAFANVLDMLRYWHESGIRPVPNFTWIRPMPHGWRMHCRCYRRHGDYGCEHEPRPWRDARGAELIEFAMVLPLFLLLTAGIFDFGMMFSVLIEAVTNAAREGARVGVLPAYEPADVEARVDAYIASAGLTGPYTVTVSNGPVATPAGTFTARSVVVNYTYQFAFLGVIGAGHSAAATTTIPLTATSAMRTETQAAAP